MNSILDKIIPTDTVEKTKQKSEPPKKHGLLLHSRRTVCSSVLYRVLDLVFHKNKSDCETLIKEYEKKLKIIVLISSKDLIQSKLDETRPYLAEVMRTSCGDRCGLDASSVEV